MRDDKLAVGVGRLQGLDHGVAIRPVHPKRLERRGGLLALAFGDQTLHRADDRSSDGELDIGGLAGGIDGQHLGNPLRQGRAIRDHTQPVGAVGRGGQFHDSGASEIVQNKLALVAFPLANGENDELRLGGDSNKIQERVIHAQAAVGSRLEPLMLL